VTDPEGEYPTTFARQTIEVEALRLTDLGEHDTVVLVTLT
jgi:hypothetical protein